MGLLANEARTRSAPEVLRIILAKTGYKKALEDEDTADPEIRNALLPEKVAAIEDKLKKLLPRLDPTPLYAWSGTFGTSETGLPAIGAVPGYRNCYAAMGFGGNGITFSAIAAQMFQRRLSGIADPDEDLFAL